jgi:protein SCO1/2
MSHYRKITIAALCLLLEVLWPEAQAMSHDQEQANGDVSFEQRLGAQIPLDLVFTDENGRTGALREYLSGAPVLLALVYYDCPQICPMVLESLARSLRPLNFTAGDQYRIVAVSIDPRETPQLAANKKRAVIALSRPEAAGGWHFLTGQQPAISRLAQAAGFGYRENDKSDGGRYVHPTGTMVLTPEGKISRYFYGFDYPPRDLRFALIEASGNRIGSAVDQLLLLCYQYDPRSGKYTITVLNILRMSGIATVLALCGGLALMLRRERHHGVHSSREVS